MDIVEKYENLVYFNGVLRDLVAMIKAMLEMKRAGVDVSDMHSILSINVRSECIFFLALSRLRGEYRTLERADHMRGYVVDNNDVIHCVGASSWIAQFDGCKESEIEHFHA